MSGDEERIAFCEREYPRLAGTLTLYTGDADLASELAQEALARACLNWRRVAAMSAPGAWLHRVGINLANASFSRRRSGRRAEERALAGPIAVAPAADAAVDGLAVRAAVRLLPPRQRAALVLRVWAGLSVRETANAMRCAEGTVKALTAQGMATLRTQLGAADDEVEELHDAR